MALSDFLGSKLSKLEDLFEIIGTNGGSLRARSSISGVE